ncbi:hypothetical protein HAX54_039972, partial [Datura stramonium]|nr:hypothetical protein [Datura stramonium]
DREGCIGEGQEICAPEQLVVLDYDVDMDIFIILGRYFLSMGRAIYGFGETRDHVRVKDEKITSKAGKGHLLPIDVGNIFV